MAKERMVRTSILESDSVNKLSWPQEVFYRRLMSIVDDFGLFEARPDKIRARLYPLKLDIVSESDIVKWMNDCSEAGLIRLYTVEGKEYLELLNFGQRLRKKTSEFPFPPHFAAIRGGSPQIAADCGGSPPNAVEEKRREVEEEERGRESANAFLGNQFRKPIPPTKKQVWEYFSGQGATKEMAKSFYEKHEGVGWYMNGSPIVNWAALANRFITNWKGNETGESTAPPLKKA